MSNPKKSKATASSLIDLFLRANETKKIKRTGWMREGIQDVESVAEHSFSLILLTMQLTPLISNTIDYPLNAVKLLKMAIIHDLGEVEVGDIVVSRGAHIDIEKRNEKELKERKGIKKLLRDADDSNLVVALFDEMIKRETIEASLIWQLDKLDLAIQALSYELDEKKDLSEFFENAKIHITNELLREFLDEVIRRRPNQH